MNQIMRIYKPVARTIRCGKVQVQEHMKFLRQILNMTSRNRKSWRLGIESWQDLEKLGFLGTP
jgi:hypothetical protein